MIASSLALVASLAACKKEAEAPKPAESSTTNTGSMSEMPMATEMKHGKGVGTVTEIDAAKGMVTLDHGDIAELQWPAMKMGFAIKPELLVGLKVGDKVSFEIDWDGKAGTVTKVEKVGS
ncbi:copper ABC transporter substrate-binding protein [Sphingomonas oleivorans]|uniref:Copper ABC transporter substrate-binding protein n=2 Tax=Sphingomonas oleivorans TaxID=1735121 RepID=A0A2T5FX19_9SPHN|nr:copper ABC transporter substrate-binding protein [Sphingomonas oleivorans]